MRALVSLLLASCACSFALAGPFAPTPAPAPRPVMPPPVVMSPSPATSPTFTPTPTFTPIPAPTPAPSIAPAPELAPTPPALPPACKSLSDCANDTTQCLVNKFATHSDQSSGRRYYVEYQNGIPKIVTYEVPSDEDNADAAECGGELQICLEQRC